MLYIGYFSFEKKDTPLAELGPVYSQFTYAIEAESADDACQQMAEQLQARYAGPLGIEGELMLDDLVEFKSIPAGGIVVRAQESPGDHPMMVSVLPFNEGSEVSNYRQGPDPADDLEAANAYEQEPFMVFGPPKRKKSRAKK